MRKKARNWQQSKVFCKIAIINLAKMWYPWHFSPNIPVTYTITPLLWVAYQRKWLTDCLANGLFSERTI